MVSRGYNTPSGGLLFPELFILERENQVLTMGCADWLLLCQVTLLLSLQDMYLPLPLPPPIRGQSSYPPHSVFIRQPTEAGTAVANLIAWVWERAKAQINVGFLHSKDQGDHSVLSLGFTSADNGIV